MTTDCIPCAALTFVPVARSGSVCWGPSSCRTTDPHLDTGSQHPPARKAEKPPDQSSCSPPSAGREDETLVNSTADLHDCLTAHFTKLNWANVTKWQRDLTDSHTHVHQSEAEAESVSFVCMKANVAGRVCPSSFALLSDTGRGAIHIKQDEKSTNTWALRHIICCCDPPFNL